MRKLTLIGGAPLSGKTTLSRRIAKEEGGVELSSDSIRSWMKQVVAANEYPGLFYSDALSPVEFYQKYNTPQSVVDGEIAQGSQVQKGIMSLLNTAITWDHFILEGIAITPEFMKTISQTYMDRTVETIVMVDKDENRIRDRISARGLWGPRGTYPEELVPKEVEWVVLYNQWFLEQAQKFGIQVHETM